MSINQNVLYYPRNAILEANQQFETPYFIYEEARLRQNCRNFKDSFKKFFPDFRPLFAVKANPNPHLLKIIQEEGFGFDCSSQSESWIVNQIEGSGMYTGNFCTVGDLRSAKDAGLILNLDDISQISLLEEIGVPELLSFRINPGITEGGHESLKVAGPNAKFGIPYEQAHQAYQMAKDLGVKRFGIHMMAGSNVLQGNHFSIIIERLFSVIADIRKNTGVEIEFLNMGGGLGVPYQPNEQDLDLAKMAAQISAVFDENCQKYDLPKPQLMAEPGRLISANSGWLVGEVTSIKESYKKFVGIDAATTMMPRTAIYDAYHHLSVLERDSEDSEIENVSVVGRLCENNDFFARDRDLPKMEVGDHVIVHNCGGHAYAMASNYNGFLRTAEYLIKEDGQIEMIRRGERIEDLYGRIV